MLGSKLQCFFGSNCCFCTRTSQAVKYRLLLRNKSWDLGIKLDLMHKDVHVGIAFRPHENQHDKKARKLCTEQCRPLITLKLAVIPNMSYVIVRLN